MKSKVYVIDGPWPGQLAIVSRPRGGDWLDDEIAEWRRAGLEVVVSALTPDEIESMELVHERATAQRHGVEVLSFPIPDRGVPESLAPNGPTRREEPLFQLPARTGEGGHARLCADHQPPWRSA